MTTLDERIISATVGALELQAVHLGRRLGLYDSLAEADGLTSQGLADEAGIAERYAREWLEAQAVGGYVDVVGGTTAADRRYGLNEEQLAVFVQPEDPAHVSSLADMVAGVGGVLEAVAAAFRSGEGVPYADYGASLRDGQGAINRPLFTHDLVGWFEHVPGISSRLAAGEPVRIADLAMGQGWSTIAMSRGLPTAEVIGFDNDAASVADARANAKAAGVDVRFEQADASDVAAHGPFDVILVVEALHDMSRPVEVLRAARRALAPGGCILVADEAVAETFTAPGDEIERMMYGWSVVHCLPASLAESPSAAIGTVIRPDTIAKLAAEAGFAGAEVLDIDAGFFRVYQLPA